MKAGIYLRVSTDMQAKDGESLAEQEATCQAYCNFRNIPIINIYREEGKSGKDTNRPQFQKMIRDCKLGKIDTVIVKKVDRLSRSLIDFERTIKFFEDQNANLISINENFDTSTAIGRAVIRIILTFAQLEREQTSERTIDVLKFRAEQGQWNGGCPPLGYDHHKDIGLIPNVKEIDSVNLIFNKYIELASYRKVAEYINSLGYRTKAFNSRRGKQQGGNKFIDTSIATILKNPVYIGQIKYKGNIYPGKHQPIIDKEKFSIVQEIINQNNRRKASIKKVNKHNFLLEGLIKCGECNSIMTPKWCLSANKHRYFYYNCSSVNHSGINACTTRTISAPVFEQLILDHVRAISNDEQLLQKIICDNGQSFQKEVEELESKRMLLKMRLKELEEKGGSLVTKISQMPELGEISFVTKELTRIEQDKESIQQETDQIVFKVSQLKNRIINKDLVKEAFQYFNRIYKDLTPDLKRYIIKLLIKDITYNKTFITINFFESNDILDLTAGWPAGRFETTMDWLRSDKTKQTFASRFNINSYQAERGKIIYKNNGQIISN